jgi:hypothetical protein
MERPCQQANLGCDYAECSRRCSACLARQRYFADSLRTTQVRPPRPRTYLVVGNLDDLLGMEFQAEPKISDLLGAGDQVGPYGMTCSVHCHSSRASTSGGRRPDPVGVRVAPPAGQAGHDHDPRHTEQPSTEKQKEPSNRTALLAFYRFTALRRPRPGSRCDRWTSHRAESRAP